jgi:hypothetical protein
MPSLPERLEATAAPAACRIDAHEAEGYELVHRDYVPSVGGYDVGYKEVNLLGVVGLALASLADMPGVDRITAAARHGIGG